MRHAARAGAVVAALALAPGCSQTSGQAPEPAPGAPRIRLATSPAGQRTIDVAGLPAVDLAHLERTALSRDAWQAVLRIHVAQADPAPAELPPVLGDYAVHAGALRFTPRFPFDAGQRYEVVFDPSSLPSAGGRSSPTPSRALRTMVEVPAPDREPSTRVVAVYPTGPEVPENHLRLYIVFSAAMGLGGGSAHVGLLDEHGRPVADPFLPLDVDLWNADRTRFTVLYDPGRVKRGIRPNAELGRPLEGGRRYTLVIDADWRDAAGQPLVAPFRREFIVGPARERALDPAEWRLDLPAPGTRDPLAVRFPATLDYGLLQRALRVATGDDRPLAGEIRVEQGETRWTFTPRAPWRPGEYRLVAAATLEDVAGNRIGRPFEVDAAAARGSERARGAVVPFRIGGPLVHPNPVLTAQTSGVETRLIGISPVDENTVWISGTDGTYARTTDGGTTWQAGVVPGAEALQFRDVHAVDAATAYLLSIGEGEQSRIYKTTDAGLTWALQFTNPEPEGFFDCMDFWDAQHGIAFSDSFGGAFFLVTTADGGTTWERVPPDRPPPATEGEGSFAASGTCLVTHGEGTAWVGTGAGASARVLKTTDRGRSWTVADTPIVGGTPTAGIASLAFRDANNGAAFGGVIDEPDEYSDNVAVTSDGGSTWTLAGRPSFAGAVYGAAYAPGAPTPTLVAVGPDGMAYSADNGTTWTSLDPRSHWSVGFASLRSGWAIGPAGRVTHIRLFE